MKFLELFAGSCSVSKAFAARGWTGTCVDLKRDIDPPTGFDVWIWDVRNITADYVQKFDFIWASSPCEEFSVWTMKHFHPNPKYPATGIALFNHTWLILEGSGMPYVMENVKGAQIFVGQAMARCLARSICGGMGYRQFSRRDALKAQVRCDVTGASAGAMASMN